MPSPLAFVARRRASTRSTPRVDARDARRASRSDAVASPRSRVDRRASPRSGATGAPNRRRHRDARRRRATRPTTRRRADGDARAVTTDRETATARRVDRRARRDARRRREWLRRRRRREWTRSPRRWARSTPSGAADTRRARGADERLTAIVDAYDDAAVEGAMRALSGRDDAAAVAALARRRARCDEGAARASGERFERRRRRWERRERRWISRRRWMWGDRARTRRAGGARCTTRAHYGASGVGCRALSKTCRNADWERPRDRRGRGAIDLISEKLTRDRARKRAIGGGGRRSGADDVCALVWKRGELLLGDREHGDRAQARARGGGADEGERVAGEHVQVSRARRG